MTKSEVLFCCVLCKQQDPVLRPLCQGLQSNRDAPRQIRNPPLSLCYLSFKVSSWLATDLVEANQSVDILLQDDEKKGKVFPVCCSASVMHKSGCSECSFDATSGKGIVCYLPAQKSTRRFVLVGSFLWNTQCCVFCL